jgi:hypothetical protein
LFACPVTSEYIAVWGIGPTACGPLAASAFAAGRALTGPKEAANNKHIINIEITLNPTILFLPNIIVISFL